tara:strand:+ start:2773 stop:3426 length:654 start_codon:yes stop_codon:yes gene_type:complete
MSDLGNDLEKIEGLKDKKLKVGGYGLTPTQIGMAFALISTIVGGLYGGFVMYQKIENIAGLDIDAYSQKMDLMDARIEAALDYSRDIKNGLRDDILRIEKVTDRTEDEVNKIEANVRAMLDVAEGDLDAVEDKVKVMISVAEGNLDAVEDKVRVMISDAENDVNDVEDKVRTMISDAEGRFEIKRDQLRTSNKTDLADLEERINSKVQRALDNPLAN